MLSLPLLRPWPCYAVVTSLNCFYRIALWVSDDLLTILKEDTSSCCCFRGRFGASSEELIVSVVLLTYLLVGPYWKLIWCELLVLYLDCIFYLLLSMDVADYHRKYFCYYHNLLYTHLMKNRLLSIRGSLTPLSES